MNCSTSLPGIRFIGYLSPSKNRLPKLIFQRFISGDEIALNISPDEINFCGSPQLTQQSEISSKGTTYKTELTFQTAAKLALEPAGCFYIVDVTGNDYIIGVAEKPHPIITYSKENGSAQDKNVFVYTVSSVYPLISINPVATAQIEDEDEQ